MATNKTFKIKYQTVSDFLSSRERTIKIEAPSELDAEIKLDDMFDNKTIDTQLYSFDFVK